MTVMNWRQRSACRGLDPEIFYPATDEEADEAKSICAICPVRQMCLEHALMARASAKGSGGDSPNASGAG